MDAKELIKTCESLQLKAVIIVTDEYFEDFFDFLKKLEVPYDFDESIVVFWFPVRFEHNENGVLKKYFNEFEKIIFYRKECFIIANKQAILNEISNPHYYDYITTL